MLYIQVIIFVRKPIQKPTFLRFKFFNKNAILAIKPHFRYSEFFHKDNQILAKKK